MLANLTASGEVSTLGAIRTNREQARSYRCNQVPVNSYFLRNWRTGPIQPASFKQTAAAMTERSSPTQGLGVVLEQGAAGQFGLTHLNPW